jgi:hypothetical protein
MAGAGRPTKKETNLTRMALKADAVAVKGVSHVRLDDHYGLGELGVESKSEHLDAMLRQQYDEIAVKFDNKVMKEVKKGCGCPPRPRHYGLSDSCISM